MGAECPFCGRTAGSFTGAEDMSDFEIPVGRTTSSQMRYVQEVDPPDHRLGDTPQGLQTITADVTERSWDVMDPDTRLRAAKALLGDIDASNRYNAQWWIDAERNAAALCVYRPHTFKKPVLFG